MAISLRFIAVLALFAFLFLPSCMSTHHHMDHTKHQGTEMKNDDVDHSAHMAMMKKDAGFTYSMESYQVPNIVLTNQAGEKIRLDEFLKSSEPYALNYIFTTCTTICPILTASFSHMQRSLGDDANDVHFVSITIDPEYDTPEILKAYAEKTRATRNWTFLTGDFDAVMAAERAFDAYTADKMNHRPTYIIKNSSTEKWIRVEGLTSGSDLADLYQMNDLFQE